MVVNMNFFESPDTDEPKTLCDICEWKFDWGDIKSSCMYQDNLLLKDEKFCENFEFNFNEIIKKCFSKEYIKKINILINRGFLIYIHSRDFFPKLLF